MGSDSLSSPEPACALRSWLEQMSVGETETAIAEDYRIPVELVAAAIQFELSRLPETA